MFSRQDWEKGKEECTTDAKQIFIEQKLPKIFSWDCKAFFIFNFQYPEGVSRPVFWNHNVSHACRRLCLVQYKMHEQYGHVNRSSKCSNICDLHTTENPITPKTWILRANAKLAKQSFKPNWISPPTLRLKLPIKQHRCCPFSRFYCRKRWSCK